jgi:hypothetical protein
METEENKRSATEILLDLERRIIVLEKRFQNSENLLKIAVGRLNQICMPSVKPQSQPQQPQQPQPQPQQPQPQSVAASVVNKDNFDNRLKTSKFAQMAAQQGLDVEDEPDIETEHIEEVFQARPQGPIEDHEDMIEASSRGNVRGQRTPQVSDKKSSISQIIKRGDAPLYIANVEVFDESGQLINQTRTNTKGRWLMALAPGSYRVHVLKRFPPDSGKLPIDTSYQINVPPSNKPMELDSLILADSL